MSYDYRNYFGEITLTHAPGLAEWTGVLLSVLSAAALIALGIPLVNRARGQHDSTA